MKKSTIIKRVVLLLIVLLTTMISACTPNEVPREMPREASSETPSSSESSENSEKEKPTLSILLDFPNYAPNRSAYGRQALEETLRSLSLEYTLDIQEVPGQEPERSPYLTGVRTELMAGKGPDLFLVDCYMGNLLDNVEGSLFPFPEQAMENHLLLPLDGYLKKSEEMDWEAFLPIVMEAGRNEEGQQILPLTFQIPANIAQPDIYALPDPLPETREEMLASGDPLLRYTALPMRDGQLLYFGNPVDAANEELTFTEEDLQALALEYREGRRIDRSQFTLENGCYPGRMVGKYLYYPESTVSSDTEYQLLTQPNRTGGITAAIVTYGAVNRNAQNPDAAFAALDLLLSPDVQQNSRFYAWAGGMPVNRELGDFDHRFVWDAEPWFLNDHNFAQYQEALDKVDAVKFYSSLDREAEFVLTDVCDDESVTEETLKREVHKIYTTMKMMLAES